MSRLSLLVAVLFLVTVPVLADDSGPSDKAPKDQELEAVASADAPPVCSLENSSEVQFMSTTITCGCNCRCDYGFEFHDVETTGTCSALNWQPCRCSDGSWAYYYPCFG